MTQCQKIAKIMLNNINKRIWSAKDFQQYGDHFIGYEASARMSELLSRFPNSFISGKEGRFRTLQLNLECEEAMIDLVSFVNGVENERD